MRTGFLAESPGTRAYAWDSLGKKIGPCAHAPWSWKIPNMRSIIGYQVFIRRVMPVGRIIQIYGLPGQGQIIEDIDNSVQANCTGTIWFFRKNV